MPSSPLSAAQVTALQTKRTACLTVAPTHAAAGLNSIAAYEQEEARFAKEVNDREMAVKLV